VYSSPHPVIILGDGLEKTLCHADFQTGGRKSGANSLQLSQPATFKTKKEVRKQVIFYTISEGGSAVLAGREMAGGKPIWVPGIELQVIGMKAATKAGGASFTGVRRHE